jgi:predicted DCC family thiol-disulfide oxidoreductase YuxK
MKNRWTAGQYALFRVLFGSYLFVHFAQLVPSAAEVFSNAGSLPDGSASPILHLFPNVLGLADSPVFATGFVAAGAALSLFFAAGLWDRGMAVGIWYIWACLLGRNPLISNPSIPFVGWILLAHAFLPRAHFGAWVGRGEAEREVPWRMPDRLFLAAWILLALGYSYSGWTKLMSPSWRDGTAILKMLSNALGRPGAGHAALLALPAGLVKAVAWGALTLELSYAPLALLRRCRPWLWSSLLGMHLLLLFLVDFADLSLGMVMIHFFTFDPGWIRPRAGAGPSLVLYDGGCGLCHRFVRFLVSEDLEGAFRFAPLEGAGETIEVTTPEGVTLRRSSAVLHLLDRLGGLWRLMGLGGRLLPAFLRDALYDSAARLRGRLFRPPGGSCPLVPSNLQGRFIADRG